ncbi:hypothetical protein PsYK624_161600 [Phanerochaete sordida]|uniref:Uncharacterized protein n=1 Tax=Phanerochaete sordida TaxID=48140 RepID=A0A9P3GS97_9APHY|nr:hypothetical protein PsYK624_161600 [Phanerochaete sordida]
MLRSGHSRVNIHRMKRDVGPFRRRAVTSNRRRSVALTTIRSCNRRRRPKSKAATAPSIDIRGFKSRPNVRTAPSISRHTCICSYWVQQRHHIPRVQKVIDVAL